MKYATLFLMLFGLAGCTIATEDKPQRRPIPKFTVNQEVFIVRGLFKGDAGTIFSVKKEHESRCRGFVYEIKPKDIEGLLITICEDEILD